MRKTMMVWLAAVLLAGCGGSLTYQAEQVPNGQMIVLKSGERIVIDGIKAPAEGEEGFQDSRDILRRLVTGKNLKVVRKGEAQDGSTVADIFVDNVSVATVMKVMNAALPAKTPRKKK